MRLQDRLRREGHAADFVAALLTQQRLRARAVAKFGEFADDMLYTADGLEQAVANSPNLATARACSRCWVRSAATRSASCPSRRSRSPRRITARSSYAGSALEDRPTVG